jgi:hypothetical protein
MSCSAGRVPLKRVGGMFGALVFVLLRNRSRRVWRAQSARFEGSASSPPHPDASDDSRPAQWAARPHSAADVATLGRLSRESAAATRDRLSRMRDLAMVKRFRRAGLLVAAQHALERINPNAAPAYGAIQSTHLMDAAVDLSKSLLSEEEIAWFRTVLWRLKRERALVDVAEEFRDPHFHVMVRRSYGEYATRLPSPVLAEGAEPPAAFTVERSFAIRITSRLWAG